MDLKIRYTWDIIEAAERGLLPVRVMLNMHPQRWDDRFGPWVRELVWQNVKNVVKKNFNVETLERQSFALSLLRFPVENIVSSDCPKNQCIFRELKGETIFHGNRSLPSISCSLYSLHAEGRMSHVLQKNL